MRNLGVLLGMAMFAAFLAAADTLDLPHQKVGLWQQTMSQDGRPLAGTSLEECLDAAVENKISVFGQQTRVKLCPSQKISHNADGSWSIDATCKIRGGMKTKAHTIVSGDFNSKIMLTSYNEINGAPLASMNGKHTVVITSTWIGPCQAGQRGGDVIMSNGMKLNLLDMEKATQSLQAH